MSRRAQLPDGTILEFPDDTTDAVMDGVVRKHLGVAKAHPAKPKDTSALNAFSLGAIKPLDNLARLAMQIPGVERADRALANAFGMPNAREAVASNQAARANNARTGWQMTGNIAGTVPTLAIPGGAFTQGAAGGALLSDADNPWGVATDATVGGIGGKAGDMLFKGLSYAAKPVVNKASQLLNQAGIPQTLGQIAAGGKGWGAKLLSQGEEAMTSVLVIGDLVQSARHRGVDGFNSAIANRALKNIGEAVPKDIEPGIEMVDFVGDRLSQKYQQLVPKLVGKFDKDFVNDLAAAKQATAILPDARQAQFGQIVKDVFMNRAKGSPQITGAELKDAESRLTTLIKKYAKSTDADQTIMADALSQVRDALRGTVLRNNPAQAKELQALNKGWAQLATFRQAANAPGNATGVVTPAQMLSASRGGPRDDLLRAAKAVLPSTVPDSGTARRAMAGLLLGGGVGSTALGPSAFIPAAGALPYTQAGQKLLNAFVFKQRPKLIQNSAALLNAFAKAAPVAAPAVMAQRSK